MSVFYQQLAQRVQCLSACWGEPVCHWCGSHHQRRTSAPCRAVGVCCWAASPSPTSSMKGPSHGMLHKTCGSVRMESCWLCFPCLPQLLAVCDGSTSSSPFVQRREFHISGSLPEHIFGCHSQGLGPGQFHGTCHCPYRAGPPWDQLCSLAALECSKKEKPCGSVRKVSDYWQSTLIYINNSAILNILCIVLISDILSIMRKYCGVRCDFNT